MHTLQAQVPLIADAGAPTAYICPNGTYTLGGSPSAFGGSAPYTYSWSPTTGLNNPTSANPIAQPSQPTLYTLTVTDVDGNTAKDSAYIDVNAIAQYGAGNDTTLCLGSELMIGAPANTTFGGVTYSWSPAAGLNSTTDARPICTATVTTLYTVVVSSPSCPNISSNVLISVQIPPVVIVTPSVATINEGQAVVLIASGAEFYFWSPPDDLSNANSALVNAEPKDTVTYLVAGFDRFGCVGYASATINVIPNSEVYYFNSFSPNGDGVNDLFFIGNIDKYPNSRIDVFGRTGQLVYSKSNYDNTWDGTNYGERVPDATYYFVLDLGDGSAKIYDSVTIVR